MKDYWYVPPFEEQLGGNGGQRVPDAKEKKSSVGSALKPSNTANPSIIIQSYVLLANQLLLLGFCLA